MEITNGQPLQNSIQYSVFPRRAECHCQVAEFQLHKYERMIKSKFTDSNALLHSEYAIIRKDKEDQAMTFSSSLLSEQITTVCYYPCIL
jgi:hypothetical protein